MDYPSSTNAQKLFNISSSLAFGWFAATVNPTAMIPAWAIFLQPILTLCMAPAVALFIFNTVKNLRNGKSAHDNVNSKKRAVLSVAQMAMLGLAAIICIVLGFTLNDGFGIGPIVIPFLIFPLCVCALNIPMRLAFAIKAATQSDNSVEVLSHLTAMSTTAIMTSLLFVSPAAGLIGSLCVTAAYATWHALEIFYPSMLTAIGYHPVSVNELELLPEPGPAPSPKPIARLQMAPEPQADKAVQAERQVQLDSFDEAEEPPVGYQQRQN